MVVSWESATGVASRLVEAGRSDRGLATGGSTLTTRVVRGTVPIHARNISRVIAGVWCNWQHVGLWNRRVQVRALAPQPAWPVRLAVRTSPSHGGDHGFESRTGYLECRQPPRCEAAVLSLPRGAKDTGGQQMRAPVVARMPKFQHTCIVALLVLMAVLAAVFNPQPAEAVIALQDVPPSISSADGVVEISSDGGDTWTPADLGAPVAAHDSLRTGDGTCVLAFSDYAVVGLMPETTVTMLPDIREQRFELVAGWVYVAFDALQPGNRDSVLAPLTLVSATGPSIFTLEFNAEGGTVKVLDGGVDIRSDTGSFLSGLQTGEAQIVTPNASTVPYEFNVEAEKAAWEPITCWGAHHHSRRGDNWRGYDVHRGEHHHRLGAAADQHHLPASRRFRPLAADPPGHCCGGGGIRAVRGAACHCHCPRCHHDQAQAAVREHGQRTRRVCHIRWTCVLPIMRRCRCLAARASAVHAEERRGHRPAREAGSGRPGA